MSVVAALGVTGAASRFVVILSPTAPGVTPDRQGVAGAAVNSLLTMHTELIEIPTGDREKVVDLTEQCERLVAEAGAEGRARGPLNGLLHVFVPHATAGIAVLETGAGSDDDLLAALRTLLPPGGPDGGGWRHRHGSSGHGRDHVLPALLPPYATLPVVDGRLALGTWQSVCLVDTNVDNRVRQVRLSFIPG